MSHLDLAKSHLLATYLENELKVELNPLFGLSNLKNIMLSHNCFECLCHLNAKWPIPMQNVKNIYSLFGFFRFWTHIASS